MSRTKRANWARIPKAAATVAMTTLVTAVACGFGASAALAHGPRKNGWFHRERAFYDQVIFSGSQLQHPTPNGSEPLAGPDDIAYLEGRIFVIFQNGVGPQGQPSSTGNTASTVVQLTRDGYPVARWDIAGHADGLTADPQTGQLIATVNEDANSSLYTIDPRRGTVVHYSYSEPLPSNGGTDSISIHDGTILISASAPGTTGAPAPQPTYPAVYEVTLDPTTQTAAVVPLFYDESSATVANLGSGNTSTSLGLTDPDSNENVPFYAPRFGGDFMLDSQGDQQQVYVHHPGSPDQSLSVLNLSTAINDTAWPLPWGRLYATDAATDSVNLVSGRFGWGSVLVAATPCDANTAPSTCPGPGYPANYLGQLNPWTGAVTPVNLAGAPLEPAGLLFVPWW